MIFFDLETTANGGPKGDSPEAHWLVNKVLLCGWKHHSASGVHINDNTTSLRNAIELEIKLHGSCTLIAHNAKFDIKYLMRDHPELPWHKVKVWDTMTWQYRHTGHSSTFPSLEDTAKYHGVPMAKSLDLGAILASGLKMEDIPIGDLTAYLEGDVVGLERLYEQQKNTGEEYWMNYILPLCEMELNGLLLDKDKANALNNTLNVSIDTHYAWAMNYIMSNCEWQDGSPVIAEDFSNELGVKSKCIKPFANRTASFLLFGEPGELKITQKWRLHHRLPPLYDASKYYTVDPTHVGYPVDEAKLSSLPPSSYVHHLLNYRLASKLQGTYVGPFLDTAQIQGSIYPKLNTTITATGRLSSSQPNGQNMPGQARELICATLGHVLEELDFKQLEMVGAASVSMCQALIHDLANGVDIHHNTASSVFGASHAEEKRKLAKNVNFGVLYGGKAPGLSKQTGVDRDIIQKLIDAFYSKYPGIARHQRQIYEEVIDNMVEYDIKDGEQRYCSDWIVPLTGRKFRFIENAAPQWLRKKLGRKWSFSPNHTANYPIQGVAGGDIVMYALWFMWFMLREDKIDVKFRMTVHDSILIERQVGTDLRGYYDAACHHTKKRFNLPLDLEYDLDAGFHWQ